MGADGVLMRVAVETSGGTWVATTPTKLLDVGRYYPGTVATPGRMYDITPDGQRFLMIRPGSTPDQTTAPASIIVVQNWFEELKRIVPTKQ